MSAGKWIGAALGWIMSGGSILGALAGLCIGTLVSDAIAGEKSGKTNADNGNFDPQFAYEEKRNSFLFSLLVLSSHIIRADGKVMHSEMEYVRNFLRQNFGEQSVAQGEEILLKLFDIQKQQGYSQWHEMVMKSCVEIEMHMNEGQRLQLLSYLVMIAKADGKPIQEEVSALKEIARSIGLSDQEVDAMLNFKSNSTGRRSSADELSAAYKVLEISPSATDDEVKAAYRKMALKHHPDKVASLGEDIRKAAEAKFQEINAAKDVIYKARGL